MKEVKEALKLYMPNIKKENNRKDVSANDVLNGIMFGDIIGSKWEGADLPDKLRYEDGDGTPENAELFGDGHRFTDDSVLSVAIYFATKKAIDEFRINPLFCNEKAIINTYASTMRKYAKMYPNAGFSSTFYDWAVNDVDNKDYKSYGDGSAMRSGVIGAMFENVRDVIRFATYSAMPTHSHPDGIKGAVITAVLVWMGLHGYTKEEMCEYASKFYPKPDKPEERYFNQVYADLSISDFKDNKYTTNGITCNIAMPLAIINFRESNSYEECIRNCLRYTGDTDTIMAISGGFAAAYYGEYNINGHDVNKLLEKYLSENMRISE